MRLWKKLLISLVTLIATLGLLWLSLIYLVYRYEHHREKVIERLDSPRIVQAWATTGFVLDDGSVVPLPGIATLPNQSGFLDEIVRRGIEVEPGTGRVFGLLPIHHWCGNDPVGTEIARIDVSRLLEYVGGGTTSEGASGYETKVCRSDAGWSRFGWRVECYSDFQRWLATR